MAESIGESNPEDSPETRKYSSINKSKKFMIVCADKRAAEAAKNILEKGGNALDAAIAAQNVLSVVEPQSSGVGGGGFLLFFNNKTNEIHAWDGREFAPRSASFFPNASRCNDLWHINFRASSAWPIALMQ